MNDDVISAFLDDEQFDAAALEAALATPEGRRLLVDALALRQLVHGGGERARIVTPTARPRRLWLIAASILLPLALVAGFAAGWRTAERSSRDDAPPAPTRVVDDVKWQVSKGGN